jgi:uncharacterized membrane protein
MSPERCRLHREADEDMLLSLYEVAWIFVIYAFLGWCTEVVYCAADSGEFVNRGFLNGPFCPVYGFGVLFVVIILTPIKESLLLLFFGSLLLTSLLEFVTGFIMERFFNDKWWDYSDEPFNIKGYVCLKFSLAWGAACVLVVSTIHPLIMDFVGLIPLTAGELILLAFIALLLTDTVITVTAAIGMKKRLALMNELGTRLVNISNIIGEPLAEGALDVKEKFGGVKDRLDGVKDKLDGVKDRFDDVKDRFEANEKFVEVSEKLVDIRQELEELSAKLKALAGQKRYVQKRILRSFPRLQAGIHKENIERIKQHWHREN